VWPLVQATMRMLAYRGQLACPGPGCVALTELQRPIADAATQKAAARPARVCHADVDPQSAANPPHPPEAPVTGLAAFTARSSAAVRPCPRELDGLATPEPNRNELPSSVCEENYPIPLRSGNLLAGRNTRASLRFACNLVPEDAASAGATSYTGSARTQNRPGSGLVGASARAGRLLQPNTNFAIVRQSRPAGYWCSCPPPPSGNDTTSQHHHFLITALAEAPGLNKPLLRGQLPTNTEIDRPFADLAWYRRIIEALLQDFPARRSCRLDLFFCRRHVRGGALCPGTDGITHTLPRITAAARPPKPPGNLTHATAVLPLGRRPTS